jgi:ribose transport system substrate-binding protein
MTRRITALLGSLTLAAVALTPVTALAQDAEGGACAGAEQGEFYDQAECERQLAFRDASPEGDAAMPWLQAYQPVMVDTSAWVKEAPYKVCFSNAGVNNPWRVVGFNNMEHEVAIQQEAGLISEFVHVDAGGDDNKQISDMQDLLTQDCDALIVAPNTTAALTPAVEAACEANVPIIVFDRGVTTSCPVSFIHPIGGYAFGATAAEFIADQVPEGGKVLALRILPGVDVLETRWSGAEALFEQKGLEVLGPEFTDGDPSKTKSIVTDYLQRGDIDGVWMDAGATSVGAIEAFEDVGLDVPPINGEDQNDFLQKWSDNGLNAIAPTYPTFQWRTPVIAAVQILQGESVPEEWVLPQPTITSENLAQYFNADMPPLYYAMSSAETMPGFPEDWQ